MAVILNVNRDPKKSKAVQPSDLMPVRAKRKAPPAVTDISALKMFLPKGSP